MASDEKKETLADIVAEMRHGFNRSWHEINREWAHGLADRIEAAAKRAYHDLDINVCALNGVNSCEIDAVREALDITLGGYYE